MTFTILHGNNLEVLPTLPDNSVDSIVTDPPYELGFMGKKWDSSGIAYSVELWTECLRVLKPGGHLLSFGGTRTFHRVAVAIEDSGFEIRDNIAWLYGSGFPKSLDVSKAIDKGSGENEKRRLEFVAWMKTTGLNAKEINEIIGKADVGSHYLRLDQPAIATADLFDKLRPHLPEVPEAIERLVAERTGIEWTAYKNRAVLGTKYSGIANKEEKNRHTIGASKAVEVDITAPSTPEAEQWEGWGTALKPAHEPIIVARKPLIGTVAHNVLTHGTGALNIDGSRIGTTVETWPKTRAYGAKSNVGFTTAETPQFAQKTGTAPKGRWPANIILDEHTAGLLDEQSGQVKGGTWNNTAGARHFNNDGKPTDYETKGSDKSIGGASRFFYVAKASKRDRNEGLEGLEDTAAATMVDREADSAGMSSPRAGAGRTSGAKNFHPTVKPTALMEYLVKLVTPPNGTVLDPFTGSGSTGKAAILNGFDFIGIEMTEDYLPIIKARLQHAETEFAEAHADKGLF
jgi:DNA modification methylase